MTLKPRIPIDWENDPDLRQLMVDMDYIAPFVKYFEKKIWFESGVCTQVQGSTSRGFVGKAGKYTVMLYALSGRVMWTIFDGDNWVSFINAEKTTGNTVTMGLHERSMSYDEIIDTLINVVAFWNGVEVDDKVRMI